MRSGAAPGAGYFGLVLSVTVPSQARKATVCWTRNEREVHPRRCQARVVVALRLSDAGGGVAQAPVAAVVPDVGEEVDGAAGRRPGQGELVGLVDPVVLRRRARSLP
jgi:hypothetical protein